MASTSRLARRGLRFVRSTWQGLVVAVVAMALGIVAWVSPGLVQADVKLDDGTIYAANWGQSRIGMLNTQIDRFAASTSTGDNGFRIFQSGQDVIVHAEGSGTMFSYDPARNQTGESVDLPANARVQMVGSDLLVTSATSGKAWFGPVVELLKLDFSKEKADFEVGENGLATLTSSGEVIGLDVTRAVIKRSGAEDVPVPFALDATTPGGVALSAVGDKAVVLDRASGNMWVEGMSKAWQIYGASDAQLMAPAPDALGGEDGTKALFSTQYGPYRLTNDGDVPLVADREIRGTPVAPLELNGCFYSATGTTFIKKCEGSDVVVTDVPDVPQGYDMGFLVNRDTVALNDRRSGVVWLVDKDMRRVDDWDQVIEEEKQDEIDQTQQDQVLQPKRTPENHPPVAQDDTLAAREGASTVLPILDNDSDPDGDVLTVALDSGEPVSGVKVQAIRERAGLQITVPIGTKGSITFDYVIDDGRKGVDRATVTVKVLPMDITTANTAPNQRTGVRDVPVQLGHSLTLRPLLDWRDADGDSLILVGATPPVGTGDEVSFTPDGELTYRDVGKSAGRKAIKVRVSDGNKETEGQMYVNVGEEAQAPIAHGDFYTTWVGEPVTLEPLANDVGYRPTLMQVTDEECGCTEKSSDDTIRFQTSKVGTYYLTYDVKTVNVSTGIIRVDVRQRTEGGLPVPALDVALLPPGSDASVVIDPLANDSDPDGDVLIVQSLVIPDSLTMTLRDHHLVEIRAPHKLDRPTPVTYQLSDGKHIVAGTIVVIPVEAGGDTTPQLVGDDVVIRAGSTQTMDVLTNDRSPIGLDLTVTDIVDSPFGEGVWVVDGDRIRVSVPKGTPSSILSFSYEVTDAAGIKATARVGVSVVPEDATNDAPRPQEIQARVLAGGKGSRLLIPLQDIDPNGDAVRLVGISSGPTLGRVLQVGDGWLAYEAYPDSQGTDSFTYRVADALGEVADGLIRVGVAQAAQENSAPVGVLDSITVRPGSHVQIAALRNDTDADSDPIRFAPESPVDFPGVGEVTVVDDRVLSFSAPLAEGTYSGTYAMEDSRGEPAYGQLLLVVTADAPKLAPETKDDVVPVAEVVGREWVEADVLKNDFDPDGAHDLLRVEVPGSNPAAVDKPGPNADATKVRIPVTDTMQQVRYVAVDADGGRTAGLVVVPGRDDAVPTRIDDRELTVAADQTLSIVLNEKIKGTNGRSVDLINGDAMSATHGAVTSSARGEIRFVPGNVAYEGPASVVVGVRDVVPDGDRTAKEAWLTIPIKVLPATVREGGSAGKNDSTVNTAPRLLSGEPKLEVGQGEPQKCLALSRYFVDDEGDEFTFEGLQVVSGSSLIQTVPRPESGEICAQAAIDVPAGTVATATGVVRDAKRAPFDFTVSIMVTPSTRPRSIVLADTAEALAGKPVGVAVLSNDKSSLDNPELRLAAGSAPSVISGSGTVKVDGESLTITPSEGFVGMLVVAYTVEDATHDQNRWVDGTVRVTVKDKPGKPGVPVKDQTGDGFIVFHYTPGADNGLDVMTRTATAVSTSGHTVSVTCASASSCQIGGGSGEDLRNGQAYTVSIVESNAAGESAASDRSAGMVPDVAPLPPGRPTFAPNPYGSGYLDITWPASSWPNPANKGSAITHYEAKVLDAGQSDSADIRRATGATAYRATGLVDGKDYRFQVRAVNAVGASEWSEASAADHPASVPGPVSAVEVTATGKGTFKVDFADDAPNGGDHIDAYTIQALIGGRVSASKVWATDANPNSAQTASITFGESLGEVPVMFRVIGHNRAGDGTPQLAPRAVVAWGTPSIAFDVDILWDVATLNVSSDAPTATFEYSYEGSEDWKPFTNGQMITLTEYGAPVMLQARATVGEVPDARSSLSEVRTVVPKTSEPRWPVLNRESLSFGSDGSGMSSYNVQFSMQAPASLLESGGWSLEGYQYTCVSGCTGSDSGPTGTLREYVRPEEGASVVVGYGHADYRGKDTPQESLDIKPTFETSATGVVIRNAPGAEPSCTYAGQDLAMTRGAVGEYSGTFPELPPETLVKVLTCTVNQVTLEKVIA